MEVYKSAREDGAPSGVTHVLINTHLIFSLITLERERQRNFGC